MQPTKDLFLTVSDVAERDFEYLTELRGNVTRLSLANKLHDDQAVRRLYVRMFVTLLESAVATFKHQIFESSPTLSAAERAILLEVTYDVNEKGEPFERKMHPPLLSSIKFSFRMLGKVKSIVFNPDYSSQGWQDLQQVIRIRNRLTHPKSVEQMHVSNDEMNLVDSAELWFRKTHHAFLEEYIRQLESKINTASHHAGA